MTQMMESNEPSSALSPPPLEDLLREHFLSSLDPVACFDRKGRVFEWNPAAAAAFGWSRSEALGKHFHELVLLDDQGLADDFGTRMVPGVSITGRVACVRKDRSAFTALLTGSMSSINDESSFMVVARDVSQAKMETDSLAALRDDSATGSIIGALSTIVGRDLAFGHLLLCLVDGGMVTPHLLVGQEGDAFLEVPADRFQSSPLALAMRTGRRCVVTGTSAPRFLTDNPVYNDGVQSYAVFPLRESGKLFACLNVGFCDPQGPPEHVMAVLDALCRAIEHELWTVVTEDRQERLIEHLRAVAGRRSDYLAMVSHDLRGPLTVIVGLAQTLAERWDHLEEDVKLGCVASILRSGHKLSGLVEEGLQLTLIEGGHLPYNLAPFDVGALVRRTVSEVDAQSNPAGFLLDLEADLPNAVGDEQRSWQVLTNLISNAVKYSNRSEPIEVSVSRQDEWIRIDIKDRGDGISAAELPHVFEKFYRSQDPQGRKASGSGLGLWLCSSMVEAQHGRLSATSELGVGSVFSYDLPVS